MQNFRVATHQSEGKFYTLKGSEQFLDDSGFPRTENETDVTYAKAVKDKLTKHFGDNNLLYSFYIKTDPNKNIYNPVTRYTIEPKIKNNFVNRVCKSDLVFTPVTEAIFNNYINFLKTGNEQWIVQAQRDIQ
jgi:hypothetical protein